MKKFCFVLLLIILALLAVCSLMTGINGITIAGFRADPEIREVLFVSRLPRTIALLLAGGAMAVSGLLLQMLSQNRFVEPTIVGTTQAGSLGLILIILLFPSASILMKMGVAALFAASATLLFMLLLERIRSKSSLIVPLIGIMLSSVFSAAATFLAMKYDLLQTLNNWESGDFSSVLQGRYEFLWLSGVITLLSALIADRFTVAGFGRDLAVNVGLDYRRVLMIGLGVIAINCGIVLVVVGNLPFIGLVVPNLVSLLLGDNLRYTVPWVALTGSVLVIGCDIIGRLLIYPFEIPASSLLGVAGAAIFLLLLMRESSRGR
uniref:Iron complex transport system permease n=1 Tax=Serratia marcescens TaxID=615 RepID=A0A1C3HHZ9_SERMA|nr:Iron complex transport system permease [Serratia marcescens]